MGKIGQPTMWVSSVCCTDLSFTSVSLVTGFNCIYNEKKVADERYLFCTLNT